METFLEILKYTLPSALMLTGFFFIFRQFTQQNKDKYKYELFAGNQKIVSPIRLQAYERLVLFLERIRFESLIVRSQNPQMTVKQLQKSMLNEIRNEFNHNLSQQLYISPEAWNAVVGAKEQMIRIINLVAAKEAKSTSMQMSRSLIENYTQGDSFPIETAIAFLKREAQNNFGM